MRVKGRRTSQCQRRPRHAMNNWPLPTQSKAQPPLPVSVAGPKLSSQSWFACCCIDKQQITQCTKSLHPEVCLVCNHNEKADFAVMRGCCSIPTCRKSQCAKQRLWHQQLHSCACGMLARHAWLITVHHPCVHFDPCAWDTHQSHPLMQTYACTAPCQGCTRSSCHSSSKTPEQLTILITACNTSVQHINFQDEDKCLVNVQLREGSMLILC